MPNRQLLDFASKGNFIDSDPNTAYELIEGIVGTPPLQKGSNYTQEGIQILEKLGDIQKNLVELQKSNEPLKNVSGNLNRMNNLLTICNKKLDTLDSKIALFSKNNGKRKEPPRFENNPSKLAKTKDDNT
jgi:hypothetical protein